MGHDDPADVVTVAELLEDAAAVHRISRLVVTDTIGEPVRDWWVLACYRWAHRPPPTVNQWKELAEVAMDDPTHPKVVELAACVHCVGVWAALAVLILRRLPAGRHLVRLLAISGVHTAWAELVHG